MPTRQGWRREIPLPSRPDLMAIAGLAALVALLFREVLFGRRVLYERDIHAVWLGQVQSLVRCVAAGSWPVWDPYVSFGQPFLANPANQVLYPWMWLNLVLPPASTYVLHVTAHLLFAGAGLYLLARRLGRSRPAALAGAVAWTAAGPLLSLVSVWHHLAGAAWMPWVLLAADGALRAPGAGRAILWGAAFAAQILAGSPDLCAMTAIVMALYALPSFRGRDRRAALRLVGGGVLAMAFAACLSAALWMPAVENARRSGRWEMKEGARAFWSVHPVQLLQAFLPVMPGDVSLSLPTRDRLFDRPDPFVSSIYLGLPALALAAAAFAGHRPPWLLGALALGASLVALGRHTWAYSLIVALLPPLRMLRYPSKAMVPVAFAAALLCAYGFDVWAGRQPARSRTWLLIVVIPALLGSAVVWSVVYLALHPGLWGTGLLEPPRPGHGLGEAMAPAVRKLLVAGVTSAATAALAMSRLRRPGQAPVFAAAMAVIVTADLLSTHHDLSPTAPADFYRYRPPVLEVLRNDAASRLYVFDYGRVSGKSYSHTVPRDVFVKDPASALRAAFGVQSYLFPPVGSRWGFFGSYEPDLYSLQSPQLRSLTLILRSAEETPLHEGLLRIGSVDHVLALHQEGLQGLLPVAALPGPFDRPIRVFRVPSPLPRVYAVSGARVADGLPAYRTLADPSFDPAGEVVLAQGPVEPGAGPAGATRILDLRPDRVRIAAALDRPGYVVLVDTYDPGWKATVDGRSAPVLRANAAFRAVRLGSGRHVVEMVYRPWSILVGAALSTASVIVGLGVVLARLRVG